MDSEQSKTDSSEIFKPKVKMHITIGINCMYLHIEMYKMEGTRVVRGAHKVGTRMNADWADNRG
jgi:hypothetical protein